MTADLTTRYLGIELTSPLVASASPLTGSVDTLIQLEQAGAAAVVLPSLFEEQLMHDQLNINAVYEYRSQSFAESLSYFPEMEDYNVGPHSYLQHIEDAKRNLAVPVIASINGASPGGWTGYSRSMQDAGADALELNIYYIPTDPETSAADVERQYVDVVAEVKDAISIPLAVKIGPQFTSLPHFAQQLKQAGADGLVLFNRFLEPDVDLETLQISPNLVLSQRHELRAPLRWIAIMRDQLQISLAASSGVHFAEDAVKLLLVGADIVMTTSALLKNGPSYLQEMHEWLRGWLDINEYDSVEQLKGSMSYANCPDPGALERGNYMKALISYTPLV